MLTCELRSKPYLSAMHRLRLLAAILIGILLFAGGVVFGQDATPDIVWQGHFDIHAANPEHAQRAGRILMAARTKLADLLGDTLPYKPEVYIADSQRDFNRQIRGQFPDWGAAAALPAQGKIVIKSPDHFNTGKSLEQLAAHEYAHLVMSKRSGFYTPPRWMDEGVAQYISHEWTWSDYVALSIAGVFGDFIPLEEIEKVNRFHESKAHLAYAQSYLAVEFIIKQYGREAPGIMLDSIAAGTSLDRALLGATGSTRAEFQRDFEDHLSKRYNIAAVFVDTMFFWLALAVVFVIGIIVYQKRRRQYYKQWEEEEKYHSTDFDYGDPDNPEQVDDEDEPWRS